MGIIVYFYSLVVLKILEVSMVQILSGQCCSQTISLWSPLQLQNCLQDCAKVLFMGERCIRLIANNYLLIACYVLGTGESMVRGRHVVPGFLLVTF